MYALSDSFDRMVYVLKGGNGLGILNYFEHVKIAFKFKETWK